MMLDNILMPEVKTIQMAELCSLEEALTEAGRSLSQGLNGLFKKNKFEFQELKSHFKPFWFIEAKHIIEYSEKLTHSIMVENRHAQTIWVDDKEYPIIDGGRWRKIDIETNSECYYENSISYFFNAETGIQIYDDKIYKEYISKYEAYLCKLMDKQETIPEPEKDEISSPEIQKLGLDILRPKAEHYIRQKVKNELQQTALPITDAQVSIKMDKIEFTRFELYFHPMFLFTYINSAKNEEKYVELDAITGNIIKDDVFNDMLKKIQKNKEPLIEVSAEIAGSFIPGTGYVVRELGKKI